jgi:hypothetical protein
MLAILFWMDLVTACGVIVFEKSERPGSLAKLRDSNKPSELTYRVVLSG